MNKSLLETFRNQTVLVTGHTGFKGSWLAIWLKELGAEVIGYALDPYTEQDNFVRCGLTDKINDHRADVRDRDRLQAVFEEHRPAIVFHLAAQSIVRTGYQVPKQTFDVNVGGTVNLLECCRNTESVRTIINITSDKCYQNREQEAGYREEDRMGGADPYSASKGCSELVTASYRHSFFPPGRYSEHGKSLSSVRAGNVIGGGDWARDRLIPDCIRALSAGQDIVVRNPDSTRPWQFVLEPLYGYLLLASRMMEDPARYAGAWNFGPEPDAVIPVHTVVEEVIRNWGSGSWQVEPEDQAPHEARLLALDIHKARTRLGWRPRYDVQTVIAKTIQWYRQNLSGKDMYPFCVQQIREFLQSPKD